MAKTQLTGEAMWSAFGELQICFTTQGSKYFESSHYVIYRKTPGWQVRAYGKLSI